MRKLFLILLVIFTISMSGCQYVYEAIFNSGNTTAATKGTTEKLDWIGEKSSTTMTVILFNGDKIYYYLGKDPDKETVTDFGEKSTIVNAISYGQEHYGRDFQLVIKEDETSGEQTLDAMLEILKLMDIKKYSLEDPSKEELHYLEEYKN